MNVNKLLKSMLIKNNTFSANIEKREKLPLTDLLIWSV